MTTYEKRTKVQYFDADNRGLLRLSAAMRLMQQASSEQLEAMGLPTDKLWAEDMVFLMTKMCIKVHRMPGCGEALVVGTAPVDIQGVRFVREFVVESPEGERLLSALSLWILVSPHTHKVLRPSAFPYALPLSSSLVKGAVTDLPMPKLLPGGRASHTDVAIRYSHLDLNNHVNNSCYGDFACDALPFEALCQRGIDTAVIHFQNEARWGETLGITTTPMGDGAYHLRGVHGDEAACFEALMVLGRAEG